MMTIFHRLIYCCFLFFISVVPAPAAEPIEEEFQTELGETMRCIYTAGDPAITDETLQLWLKLRYPFESFGFPRLEQGVEATSGSLLLKKTSQNLADQKQAIQTLRSVVPDDAIRPLYDAVLSTFQREYDYSQALVNLIKNKDVNRFVRTLDERFGLEGREKDGIRTMAQAIVAGNVSEDLRASHEQFLNKHVMVDDLRRHFTDFHRDFIRKYRIGIDCRCVEKC